MPDQASPSLDRVSKRLAEVFSKRDARDPTGSVGSGFLLGDGLVLTARHVLMPKNWRAQVPANLTLSARPLALARTSAMRPATLEWPTTTSELADEDAPDVALLRILDGPDVHTDPISLGLGEGESLGAVDVYAAGFPNHRAKGDIREVEQVTGRIPTLSGARSGRYEITALKMEGGRDLNDQLDWRGMSGAALFSNRNQLIGVLVLREENGRFDFAAVRLDDLLERPDFAAVVAAVRGSSVSAINPGRQRLSNLDLESGISDLTVTSVSAPRRITPLAGHPALTPPNGPSPVFTGGFHVSFTLAHNCEGKHSINLHALELEVARFEPGSRPEYAYEIVGQEIIGAGLAAPHVFKISVFGERVAPARWITDPKSGTALEAASANFLDTDDPRVITLSADGTTNEEIKCTVLARKAGFYQLRFVFYYGVAGADRQRASEMIHVYSDE